MLLSDVITDPASDTTPAPSGTNDDSISKILATVLPVAASTYQQSQLTKLNIARMQQGLGPISAADYAAGYQVPAAQFQLGMDAGTRQLLTYAGIGLVALYVLRRKGHL